MGAAWRGCRSHSFQDSSHRHKHAYPGHLPNARLRRVGTRRPVLAPRARMMPPPAWLAGPGTKGTCRDEPSDSDSHGQGRVAAHRALAQSALVAADHLPGHLRWRRGRHRARALRARGFPAPTAANEHRRRRTQPQPGDARPGRRDRPHARRDTASVGLAEHRRLRPRHPGASPAGAVGLRAGLAALRAVEDSDRLDRLGRRLALAAGARAGGHHASHPRHT